MRLYKRQKQVLRRLLPAPYVVHVPRGYPNCPADAKVTFRERLCAYTRTRQALGVARARRGAAPGMSRYAAPLVSSRRRAARAVVTRAVQAARRRRSPSPQPPGYDNADNWSPGPQSPGRSSTSYSGLRRRVLGSMSTSPLSGLASSGSSMDHSGLRRRLLGSMSTSPMSPLRDRSLPPDFTGRERRTYDDLRSSGYDHNASLDGLFTARFGRGSARTQAYEQLRRAGRGPERAYAAVLERERRRVARVTAQPRPRRSTAGVLPRRMADFEVTRPNPTPTRRPARATRLPARYRD